MPCIAIISRIFIKPIPLHLLPSPLSKELYVYYVVPLLSKLPCLAMLFILLLARTATCLGQWMNELLTCTNKLILSINSDTEVTFGSFDGGDDGEHGRRPFALEKEHLTESYDLVPMILFRLNCQKGIKKRLYEVTGWQWSGKIHTRAPLSSSRVPTDMLWSQWSSSARDCIYYIVEERHGQAGIHTWPPKINASDSTTELQIPLSREAK